MVNWLFIIAGFLFLYPAFTQLRTAYQIKSTNHFYMGLMFLSLAINIINLGLNLEDLWASLVGTTSLAGFYFFILKFLITTEEVSSKLNINWLIIISGLYLSVFVPIHIASFLLEPNSITLQLIWLLQLNFEEIIETLIGYLMWNVFSEVTPVQHDPQSRRIKEIFIRIGQFFFTFSTVRLISSCILTGMFLLNSESFAYYSPLIISVDNEILGVGVFIFGLVLFLLAVNYPKSLILSNTQLQGIIGLYDLVETIKDKEEASIPLTLIEEYLLDIAEEFKRPDESLI